MNTPLSVAVDISRRIHRAKLEEATIDLAASSAEIYLRFITAGCSKSQICEALESEMAAAGIVRH